MTRLLENFEMMDAAMADILRQKSPFERLRIAGRMYQSARIMLTNAVRTRYPDWSSEEVHREVVRRLSHGMIEHESV
jgi:hypothetical protein